MAVGSGMLEAQYFATSAPGTLGGNAMPACFNRYHQTKLANPVFAMALHEKLSSLGSKVKSVCAEPGVSMTELATNMGRQHAAAAKAAKAKAANEPKAETKKKSPRPVGPAGMPSYVPQSAADGACSLIMASFAKEASSGDFYMPGGFEDNTPKGMPVKCMTAGKPTPPNQRIEKNFKNESLTMDAKNRELLWRESEKAIGELFVLGNQSKL